MHVDISLLGGFAVVVDGRAVAAHAWTRRSAATLVKVLALRPGRQLPREQLVDLLWPDLLLEQAAPRLHKAAHYARAAVGVPSAVVPGRRRGLAAPRRGGRGRRRALRPCGGRPVVGGGRRSTSTAATCCPRTSTSRGPTPSASASGAPTWSCSARPGAGPTWWPRSRSTRRRTSGWSSSTWSAAAGARRCASSRRWPGPGATSSAPSPAPPPVRCTRARRRCRRSSRRPRPRVRARPGCRGPRPRRWAATATWPRSSPCSRSTGW